MMVQNNQKKNMRIPTEEKISYYYHDPIVTQK